MIEHAIQINSLSKHFPGTDFILQDISLSIPYGSLTAIIGRNGAGKSTLFNCILGLTDFDKGEIIINLEREQVVLRGNNQIKSATRKKIGVVFQDIALWPHLTILENVTHALIDLHDREEWQAEYEAKEWLINKLKIKEENLNKYPSQLSEGMKRRVAIARTFITDPEILLIDEVETYLDTEAVENVLKLIRNIFIENPKKTVLMITHRIDFVSSYASTLIVLNDGKLIGLDLPEKILEYPESKTVEFIKEVIYPSMSQWNFAYKCLESSVNITSLSIDQKEERLSIFQGLALEVLRLITNLEPDFSHLVLIVTRDDEKSDRLSLRGICKNEDFVLDGSDVHHLGRVITLVEDTKEGTKGNRKKYKLIDNYQRLISSSTGEYFDTGEGFTGSLIARMFKSNKFSYVFSPYPPIPGVYNTSIPPEKGSADELFYYQFSEKTKNVYLFPLEWKENIVGVLSIDTYSEIKWFPFVVKQVLKIAKLGAIAIKGCDVRSSKKK